MVITGNMFHTVLVVATETHIWLASRWYASYWNAVLEQECIPVGCVSTTAVAVIICQYHGCLPPEGWSASRGGGSASRGVGGLCLQGSGYPTPPSCEHNGRLPLKALPSLAVGKKNNKGLTYPWDIMNSSLIVRTFFKPTVDKNHDKNVTTPSVRIY